MGLQGEPKKVLYTLIEFYLSLVAYFILHMIFVIASDFVEAFNIPPLNIGIYVDKLAAIRALLMVLSDFIEWGITQKICEDGGNANQSLFGNDKDDWFKEWNQREKWNNSGSNGPGARRWASIVSFLGMLVCRCVYLYLVYKSDNKSLTVFITLCLEGFWFGLFQMGFFAIGPEFNAYTSFGIHTMGNIIFFMQVILNYYSKTKPKINCLYRVRVHAWIVVITSIIGLLLWVCFCFWANAGTGEAPNQWPEKEDVWSPFLLFIIGAFAEDFAVPGILPFAFLDPEKANLVNYLTPSFFMTGAMVTVIFNDWWSTSNFKAWSASKGAKKDKDENGMYWHSLWLLNIPKYIAFFIAMWSIHGTYADLRCIIQSRWRVMWLTLTVVVPRAVLETSGYVGVANWSIGRADFGLVEAELIRAIAYGLKKGSVNSFPVQANTLKTAIDNETNKVKEALAGWVNYKYFSSIEAKDISANTEGANQKVTVEIKDSASQGNSTANVVSSNTNQGVKVTIPDIGGKDEADKRKKATEIANRIASFVAVAALTEKLNTDGQITDESKLTANDLAGGNGLKNEQLKEAASKLVEGYNGAEVNQPNSTGIIVTNREKKVTVQFGMSKKFNALVTQLESQVRQELASQDPKSADDIAGKLERLLNQVKNQITPLAQSMVDTEKASKVENVGVSKGTGTVTVEIKPTGGGSGSTPKGESAEVEFKHTSTTHKATVVIEVKGNSGDGDTELTPAEGTAIARLVALALVDKTVMGAANGYNITMTKPDDKNETVSGNPVLVKGPAESFEIEVKLHRSLAKYGVGADTVSTELAKMIKGAAVGAAIGEGRSYAFTDFPAFDWIAWHDVTAMFCRFVYVKFAVGYN